MRQGTEEAERMLRQELTELATVDPLTRLYNRREFEHKVCAEIARVQRYGGEMSVVRLDLDAFATTAESLAPRVVDELVCDLGLLMRRNIRTADVASHWGEGRFAFIAPAMVLTEATGFAVKLRRLIADQQFPQIPTVTASLGVAQFNGNESCTALLARAERAMGRAVASGGNRVAADRLD